MLNEEIRRSLEEGIGGEETAKLRLETALSVGKFLIFASSQLADIVESGEKAEKIDKGVYAISSLMGMAGELATASARLLSTGEHYAGAALLRQIVEIEYLTWNFKENKRDPASWLESTHADRMKDFTPAQLRKTSAGRFLAKDYQHHCEEGGHPVPRGLHLLRGGSPAGAQLLLVDLLTHLWRTWDNIASWCSEIEDLQRLIEAMRAHINGPLHSWSEKDKVYVLMVQVKPDRPAPLQ
jgi:hypothetical protein